MTAAERGVESAGSDETIGAVTLTVDAALYLARATVGDILSLPVVLALLPTVLTEEDQQRVDDVIVDALEASGVLADGRVHPQVAEWMSLLCAADRELTILSIAGEVALRMVVARSGNRHVVASRCGDDVVLQEMVVSDPFDMADLAAVVCAVTGPPPPPQGIMPVVAEASELTADHVQTLLEAGATASDAKRIVAVAAATPRSITEVQVIERGRGYRAGKDHELRIVDTEVGRLMIAPSMQPDESSTLWATIGEASPERIATGIEDLIAMLPSQSWQ